MGRCAECGAEMRRVKVSVEGAKEKALSWQCPACGSFRFEAESARKVVAELESPLRIRQRITRLSKERLGLYLGKDIVQSLGLKGGEEVAISVPSRKRLVIELE